VLDPDGATLYAPDFGRKVPKNGRRLGAVAPTRMLALTNGEAPAEAASE
jgi:hypothetical protein